MTGEHAARSRPSARRDAQAARRFFNRPLHTLKVVPSEVVTDAAPVYPAVLEDLRGRLGQFYLVPEGGTTPLALARAYPRHGLER